MSLTYGLFETMADVCATIAQLREQGHAATSFSLLARDLEADSGEQDDRRPTIAQVVRALELSSVADSLVPTALVVIPEAGTYLAAGWPVHSMVESSEKDDQAMLQLLFQKQGCSTDEAAFLDKRLQSGAFLLCVSGTDRQSLENAPEVFADQQAVYVGLVEEVSATTETWAALEIPPPDSRVAGGAIIIDVSATRTGDHERIGTSIQDEAGAEVGTISHAVFDSQENSDKIVRYLVIEHGGFLGVGRHLHVIPADLIEADGDGEASRVKAALEVIENGPAYDARLPLSRREEQTICAYYGTKPYWDE